MTLSYSKVKRYVGVMTNKSFLTGTRPLNNYKNSVSVYCTIKKDCSPSSYQVLTRKKTPSRKALLKIKIRSHQLRIETGRYKKSLAMKGYVPFVTATKLSMKTISYKIVRPILRLETYYSPKEKIN